MHGGYFHNCENYTELFSEESYSKISYVFSRIVNNFFNLFKSECKDNESYYVVMTNSQSLRCEIKKFGALWVALVPAGLIARLLVISRIFIQNATRGMIQIINDKFNEQEFYIKRSSAAWIPPKLRPLFLESYSSKFWQELDELNQITHGSNPIETESYELLYVSLLYVLSHEFSHILHDHLNAKIQICSSATGLTGAEISRGLELDADFGAVAYAFIHLASGIQQDNEKNDAKATIENAFFRMSFGVAMLFGIYDTIKPTISDYSYGYYCHPETRCNIFFESANLFFASNMNNYINLWKHYGRRGFASCVSCFNWLTLDAISGKFGKASTENTCCLFTSLIEDPNPNSKINELLFHNMKHEIALLCKIQSFMPYYFSKNYNAINLYKILDNKNIY